jgi:hypothetical protein
MKTATTSFLLFTMLLGFAPETNSSTLIYALTSGALLYRSTDGAKSWARIVIDGEPASSANPALAVESSKSIHSVCRSGGCRQRVGHRWHGPQLLSIHRWWRHLVSKR